MSLTRFKESKGFMIISAIALLVSFGFGCNGEDGVSSEFATVTGTITFENIASWPDSGVVQITIWPEGVWTRNGPAGPPQNPNNPVTLIRDLSTSQVNYIIEGLPEGEYSAIAVGWRHPDETLPAERRSAVLGVYWNSPNVVSTGLPFPPFEDPLPASFTLQKGENRTGMDIKADFGKIGLFFP
ncbi:MAG: hypothetical protein ACE5IR_19060 [bacterium]